MVECWHLTTLADQLRGSHRKETQQERHLVHFLSKSCQFSERDKLLLGPGFQENTTEM